MLIDFAVGNYLSFRDQACFSLMTARSVKEHAGLEDPADSLVEYRINQATAVRNDASFGKDYLAGRYGAIPYFGNVNQFLKDFYPDSRL